MIVSGGVTNTLHQVTFYATIPYVLIGKLISGKWAPTDDGARLHLGGLSSSRIQCREAVAFNWITHTLTRASYQIRKIKGCACAGNAGNVSPSQRLQRKPLFGDPGMRHGTCVTHVPWCMSGSLTRGGGENVPGISRACATRKFTYLVRGIYTCFMILAASLVKTWNMCISM